MARSASKESSKALESRDPIPNIRISGGKEGFGYCQS